MVGLTLSLSQPGSRNPSDVANGNQCWAPKKERRVGQSWVKLESLHRKVGKLIEPKWDEMREGTVPSTFKPCPL